MFQFESKQKKRENISELYKNQKTTEESEYNSLKKRQVTNTHEGKAGPHIRKCV